MALPAAMYSNSLSGDVEWLEIADAGFGSTRISALRELAGDGRRAAEAGERHPVLDAQAVRQAPAAARGQAPCSCPPMTRPQHRRHARDRLEQNVDALPWHTDGPRRRPCTGADGARRWVQQTTCRWCRVSRVPSGTTANRGALAPKRARRATSARPLRDRDVAVGVSPDVAIRACASRASFDALGGTRGATRGSGSAAATSGE